MGEENSDPLIGVLVAGRYRLLDRIGRGGMGAVYRAEQIAMRRHVAVKIMRPELATDPAMVARFEREAHAASRIASPNVVTLFEHGSTDDGGLYIAMELLPGGSLAARLEQGPIAPRDALRIARSIARALEAAHAVGVIHRDLKPDNIFQGDGEWPLKVIDFGIAKMLDRGDDQSPGGIQTLTHAGAIIGTPAYMSPEAAARRPVGPASDLYALGIILFEMLVGRLPFEDAEPVMVLGMHLRLQPEPIRQARPDLDVPDSVERLVSSLLAKKPEERPVNAAAVVAEVDAILAELLAQQRPSTPAGMVRAALGPASPGAGSVSPLPPTVVGGPSQRAPTPLVTTTHASSTQQSRQPALVRWLLIPGAAVAAIAVVVGGVLVLARVGNRPASLATQPPAVRTTSMTLDAGEQARDASTSNVAASPVPRPPALRASSPSPSVIGPPVASQPRPARRTAAPRERSLPTGSQVRRPVAATPAPATGSATPPTASDFVTRPNHRRPGGAEPIREYPE